MHRQARLFLASALLAAAAWTAAPADRPEAGAGGGEAFPPQPEVMALYHMVAAHIRSGGHEEPNIRLISFLYERLRNASVGGWLPDIPLAEINAMADVLRADQERPGQYGPISDDFRRLHARLYQVVMRRQAAAAAPIAPPSARDPIAWIPQSGGGFHSWTPPAREESPYAAYGAIPGAVDFSEGRMNHPSRENRPWDMPAAAPSSPIQPFPMGHSPRAPEAMVGAAAGYRSPAAQWREELTRRVEERAGRPRAALKERALFLMSLGDYETALRDWENAGAESIDDMGHSLVSGYMQLMLGRFSESASQVDTAVRRYDRIRPFRAVNPAFAQSIEGFRCFEPRPERPFRAGEQTVVYVELLAPGFELVGPAWQVKYAIGVSIHDTDGNEIWAIPDFGQLTRRYRDTVREHHLAVRNIAIPSNMRPGLYRLVITVHDLVKAERAETTLPMEVAASFAPSTGPIGPVGPAGSAGSSTGFAAGQMDGDGGGRGGGWRTEAAENAGAAVNMAEAMETIRRQQAEIDSIRNELQRLSQHGQSMNSAMANMMSRAGSALY